MINRELIKENNALIKKEGVLPFKKVEELLTVNAKLRALLLVGKSKDEKQQPILVAEGFPTSEKDPSFIEATQTTRDRMTESHEISARNQYIEEIELLKLKITSLGQENGELKKRVQTAQASSSIMKSLETKLKRSEEQNIQLQAENKQITSELSKLRAELSGKQDSEKEVNQMKTELAKKDEEIKNLKAYISQAEKFISQVEELQRDRDIFEKAIDEKSEEVQTLKQRIDALEPLQRENKLIKQRYFLVRTASELLRNRIEEQYAMMDKMQQMLDTDEILDVEINFRKLSAERDVLAAQNKRMKKPIKEKILKLDLLKLKLSTELEEFQTLKNSIRQLDESQVITKLGESYFSPCKSEVGQEPGTARDELVKTLEQRKSTMRNLHNALKDVDMIKSQLDNMYHELREVNSEIAIESKEEVSDTFSSRIKLV